MTFRGQITKTTFRELLLVVTVLTIFTATAGAYPGQDDASSPATLALGFKRSSQIWARQEVAAFDAAVTTSPPDTVKLDRRIDGMSVLGTDRMLNQKFGLRLNSTVLGSKQREGPKDPPYRYTDQTTIVGHTSLDLLLITTGGLEVFAGSVWHYYPRYTRKTTSEFTSSETAFGASSHFTPRFGIVRRGAGWNGGFYFSAGAESQRTFVTSASDGSSIEGESVVHTPPEVGVFGEIKRGTATITLDLAAIQAGDGGERSETGNTVRDDFLRLRAGYAMPLVQKTTFNTTLAYQTISYASNAFMNVDTVPFWSLKTHIAVQIGKSSLMLGGVYGTGTDAQSIPEFNAKYDVKVVGAYTGVGLPF